MTQSSTLAAYPNPGREQDMNLSCENDFGCCKETWLNS